MRDSAEREETAGREWWFPCVVAVVVFLVGSVPYWYGYHSARPGEVFMDFIGRGTPGANGYLAYAKQVQEGNHLLDTKMTPEPTRRDYFNLEWWVFGQIARQCGLSLVAVFHVTRGMIVLFYVAMVYWLAALCLPSVFTRRLALLLVCFGSGLGWVIWLANHVGLHLEISRDLRGVSIFGYLVNKPHFILGAAFATLTQIFHLLAYRRGQTKFFVYSGLAAALHSLVRPYGIPETHVLWVVYPALLCLRDREVSLARFKGAGIAIAVHAPVFAYFLYYAITGSLGSPDWTRVPGHVVENFLWMGLPLVALFLGLPWYLRLRDNRDSNLLLITWFVLAWLHCGAFPYVRGGQEAAYYSYAIVPVFLTLGYGLPWCGEWLRRDWPAISAWLPDFGAARTRLAASTLLVIACLPSNAIVYREFFTTIHRGTEEWTFCISQDLYDALRWMDQHAGEKDVVMAGQRTCQFVWRVGRSKTITGHDFQTTDYAGKNQLVARFYSQPGDVQFKADAICKYKIQWVIDGEFEQAYGNASLAGLPWLKPAFHQGKVTVYAVDLEKACAAR